MTSNHDQIEEVLHGERAYTIQVGDCLDALGCLPPESVHLGLVSPPYFGSVRDYQIQGRVWGGDPGCEHQWGDEKSVQVSPTRDTAHGGFANATGECAQGYSKASGGKRSKGCFCDRCGAWLGCLGDEPDVSLYAEHLVQVCNAFRPALRADGTLVVNVGDKRSGDRQWLFVPHQFAMAMQRAGWFCEDEVIWEKPNPVPSSSSTSMTRSHEYLFFFRKTGKPQFWTNPQLPGVRSRPEPAYYWKNQITLEEVDQEPENALDRMPNGRPLWSRLNRWTAWTTYADMDAIREPLKCPEAKRISFGGKKSVGLSSTYSGNIYVAGRVKSRVGLASGPVPYGYGAGQQNHGDNWNPNLAGASKRSVWKVEGEDLVLVDVEEGDPSDPGSVFSIATHGTDLPHFASFPAALVEPIVAYCTPGGGVCSLCGAPYTRRVVVGDPIPEWQKACGCDGEGGYQGMARKPYGEGGAQDASEIKRRTLRSMRERVTSAWVPTCDCDGDAVGALVVDFFSGIGTTVLQARRMGRRGIGFELNPKFAAVSDKRIREDMPLANTAAGEFEAIEVPAEEMRMF